MILLNISIITIICCYILDISGFIDEIKFRLRKWLNIKNEIILKPFDCSLCMSHWINLLYILYLLIYSYINYQEALYYYLWTLFLSNNTMNITNFLNLINETLNTFINKIWNKLN